MLFLDEAPEYERRVLDALRQPLESGELVIHRSAGTAAYPARFQLVLAANPCPCGKASGKGVDCTCTPTMRRRYLARLSGPLLDRVDIQLEVERVSLADFGRPGAEEDTATIAARVGRRGTASWKGCCRSGWKPTPRCPDACFGVPCGSPPPPPGSWTVPWSAACSTARGYDRVLRLAWTLADLSRRDTPHADDIGQALSLRQAAVSA